MPVDPSTLAAWRKLAEEATPGEWRWHQETLFDPLQVTSNSRDVCELDTYEHRPDERMPDAAFIATARAAVPALIEECERLQKTLDDASYEDGDHLPKQCRRMIETLWGEICAHREKCPAELSALRAELARVMPVFEAAEAWRVGRDRNIVGTAPAGGQRSATGVALIDAIDAAKERAGG